MTQNTNNRIANYPSPARLPDFIITIIQRAKSSPPSSKPKNNYQKLNHFTKTLRIYASLRDESDQGFIWIHKSQLPKSANSRPIVRLKSKMTGESVYCEARTIDENFLKHYNHKHDSHLSRITITNERQKSALVISKWYRDKLGIETKRHFEIDVQLQDNWWGRCCAKACLPRNLDRTPLWRSIISFVLRPIRLGLSLVGH